MARAETSLLPLVQSYFQQHLRRVRGASDHTIRAYRDGLRLFFIYASHELRCPLADLRLEQLRVDLVLGFLNQLEATRRNGPATRNCRLAAIRGFVSHLLRQDLSRADQYRQILAIPAKRAQTRPPVYLEPDDVRAVLAQPDLRTATGARDLALLLFLYNTGARISEALSVCADDLHLARPRQVRLHGKANKDRICPLWNETARAIQRLIEINEPTERPIFRNVYGAALTRDGAAYVLDKYVRRAAETRPSLRHRRITPHVLRHSCAVALLQSGVDLTVIRDYLGHVSVATTGRYVSSNLKMKRDVLNVFWRRTGLDRQAHRRWRPTAGVLEFLASL